MNDTNHTSSIKSTSLPNYLIVREDKITFANTITDAIDRCTIGSDIVTVYRKSCPTAYHWTKYVDIIHVEKD